VWDLEVEQYGYAPPLGDAGQGGSDDTDIYVRDLGGNDNPLFGYCTTDDPAAGSSPFTDVWAYCVVDNDFSRRQFPCCETPQNFRAVTAAHEFFHAIQFHYDVREDLWLMEGTAMLMEGQFRPTVDDRIRYLDNSVLTFPRTSVDFGTNGFEYGAWIYWRFLVERFAELANPLVIRQVWERAAGSSTDMDGIGPDTRESNLYSLAATRAVLAAREPGTTFRALFARFASVNRSPSSFYIEGADYPHAAAASVRRLREGESTGWRTTKLWHLASTSYAFKRRPSLPADATIRFVVNLPEPRHGAVATLLIRRADGVVAMRTIALDGGGRGSRAVALVSSVRRVDLVLTNASTRMQCWEATPYSCSGSGSDDRRSYRYRVTVR
jgi:hypothetical protein